MDDHSGTNTYLTTTTNNVGIGTILPIEKFQVGDSSFANDAGTTKIRLVNGASSIGSWNNLVAGNIDSNDPYFAIEIRKNSGTVSEDLRIKEGNVGIGTMNPQYGKLEISTTESSSGGLTLYRGTGGTVRQWINSSDTYIIQRGASETIGLSISNVGNIGIGDTTPSYKLDVNGTGRFTGTVVVGIPTSASHATTKSYVDSAITSVGIGGYVKKAGDTMTGALIMSSGVNINFADTGTYIDGTSTGMVIEPDNTLNINADTYINMGANTLYVDAVNNSVGVGTNVPGAKLEVKQAMSSYSTAFTSPHIKLRTTNTTDNTDFVGITYDASTSVNYGWLSGALRSTNGKSSFIWKYHIASPGEKLEVNGNVSADAYYYTSDIRLKENILPIEDSLSKILKLEGISYNLIKDTDKKIGFSAQALQKVYPELVNQGEDGYLSIDGAGLIAPLVESIKEHQKMIELQQASADMKMLIDESINETVIGCCATGVGSNSITLGNDEVIKTILKGNVGVGTTTPGYKLDVSGTGRFTGAVVVGTPTDASHAATKAYVDDKEFTRTTRKIPAGQSGFSYCAQFGELCIEAHYDYVPAAGYSSLFSCAYVNSEENIYAECVK